MSKKQGMYLLYVKELNRVMPVWVDATGKAFALKIVRELPKGSWNTDEFQVFGPLNLNSNKV